MSFEFSLSDFLSQLTNDVYQVDERSKIQIQWYLSRYLPNHHHLISNRFSLYAADLGWHEKNIAFLNAFIKQVTHLEKNTNKKYRHHILATHSLIVLKAKLNTSRYLIYQKLFSDLLLMLFEHENDKHHPNFPDAENSLVHNHNILPYLLQLFAKKCQREKKSLFFSSSIRLIHKRICHLLPDLSYQQVYDTYTIQRYFNNGRGIQTRRQLFCDLVVLDSYKRMLICKQGQVLSTQKQLLRKHQQLLEKAQQYHTQLIPIWHKRARQRCHDCICYHQRCIQTYKQHIDAITKRKKNTDSYQQVIISTQPLNKHQIQSKESIQHITHKMLDAFNQLIRSQNKIKKTFPVQFTKSELICLACYQGKIDKRIYLAMRLFKRQAQDPNAHFTMIQQLLSCLLNPEIDQATKLKKLDHVSTLPAFTRELT